MIDGGSATSDESWLFVSTTVGISSTAVASDNGSVTGCSTSGSGDGERLPWLVVEYDGVHVELGRSG